MERVWMAHLGFRCANGWMVVSLFIHMYTSDSPTTTPHNTHWEVCQLLSIVTLATEPSYPWTQRHRPHTCCGDGALTLNTCMVGMLKACTVAG